MRPRTKLQNLLLPVLRCGAAILFMQQSKYKTAFL